MLDIEADVRLQHSCRHLGSRVDGKLQRQQSLGQTLHQQESETEAGQKEAMETEASETSKEAGSPKGQPFSL